MVVRWRGMRVAKALILVGIWACGSSKPVTPPPLPPQAAPGAVPASAKPPQGAPAVDPCSGEPTVDPCSGLAPHGASSGNDPVVQIEPVTIPDSHEPEWFAPAWKKVAVGQTIAFATTVIDQDLDETRVDVTKMPATATFDAITQTVTWTADAKDIPKATFELAITQPGRNKKLTKTVTINVVKGKAIAEPTAPEQTPVIETLLMIRQPERLVAANTEWPLTKMLEVGAQTFKLQMPEAVRARMTDHLDGAQAYRQMLWGLAKAHDNPRMDPSHAAFDKEAFGDPASWKIVTVRPRIDRGWTELRVLYQAMKAKEPVFAMFRVRPVVEYVPAGPRPAEERIANNKTFLGMVAKHLMKDGGPNPAFAKDKAGHGKAVAALITDVMTFDDTKTQPYLHGFMIGIATEARMGGGSSRNPDGSYKSGDGWGWTAMKPFASSGGPIQVYQNVAIPGFWTDVQPSPDNKTWVPKCADRYMVPGFEKLCRKTLGFIDLPAIVDGRVTNGKVDANNMYIEHKMKWSVEKIALEDGRRDLGEENGMTCSQCHIRNFGMHDYSDPANVDPTKGVPKKPNKKLETLNFVIVPQAKWEQFTLDFLKHQECRGKAHLEQFIGAEAAKKLTCPLAPKPAK